jgi:ethanolamine utilization protein EutM
MERDSLGLIETLGLVAAIEAADAGSKAANVTFRGYERARAGLITVVFLGDVAAVQAAVTAGSAAAKRVGTVVSVHVIARPDRQLHVVANGAKPIAKLESPPGIELLAPEQPRTAGVESAIAEGAIVEAEVVSTAACCEICAPPQPETDPEVSASGIFERPVVEEQTRKENAEAETANAYAGGNGHPPAQEEAEEEVGVAVRVCTPHKKEKVRKPRSKPKA